MNPSFVLEVETAKGGIRVKYEEWLRQIVVNVVEINQLSSHSARTMYEKVIRKLFRGMRDTNERED